MLAAHPQSRGLIFDLDGTLADTMPIHYLAWKEVAGIHAVDFTEELFYQWAGIPTFKIIGMLNELFGTKMDIEETHDAKENAFVKRIEMVQPIVPVMNVLINNFGKMPVSVGTGGVPDVVQLTLKAINAAHFFDIIVTAKDVNNFKPAPDTFLLCAERMKIAPKYCEVFEDSDLGLEAARAAGMIATDIRKFI